MARRGRNAVTGGILTGIDDPSRGVSVTFPPGPASDRAKITHEAVEPGAAIASLLKTPNSTCPVGLSNGTFVVSALLELVMVSIAEYASSGFTGQTISISTRSLSPRKTFSGVTPFEEPT